MDRLDCDRMFIAVMELGSFARAAERLRTSAGQASKMVTRLERDLGARLLNRTTRALGPTEVGQAYYERMRGLLEELDALDAQVRRVAERPTGRLRLTAPLSFGAAQLSPALLDFAAAYPGVELDVSFSDRVVSLVDEGFDAAVRIGRPADSSLIARRLTTVRIILVASEAYLTRAGTPVEPAELSQHDCIIDTNLRDPLIWRFRAADGAQQAVAVHGRLRFSDAATCLAAAEAGLGIACAPAFVVGDSLRAGRVKPLLTGREDEPFGVFVLYPPGRYLAAKVRVLVDFLAERYREPADWNLAGLD